jgi:DNA-directed RNA polymerase subunit K/omega
MGAQALVETHGESDTYLIALKELKAMAIPIIIRRYLPSLPNEARQFEDWKLSELAQP